ncbi:plasmid replication protein, CyRepA1 family, partial [Microcoleus sp. AT9_A5]
ALGFWEWVEATNCPVILTEGEKKALALISRGYAAIGLPGINTGYRVTGRGDFVKLANGTEYQKATARELHEALQKFDTPGREITIIFDYREGDYSQSKEFKAACTTAKLFRSAIAKIAILPGPDKGVDDFCVAGGDIDAVLADAKDYRKLAIENQWRRNRQYAPTHTINSRYFHAPAPATGTITGIKSGLATGKTQWLKDIIASNPEGKIIVLGGRNGLLLQTAEKCGFYHLNAHNGYQMFKDPNARLCLCFDSLLKLPPDIFEGATIILDEAESVIRHLLLSPTLKHNREAIKARFTAACCDADRIILLDGHLADYTVELVAKLAGNKTVTKHLNEFKGNCPKVSIYETEKATPTAAEKQDFINRILASDCPVIPTDCSVAEAEALALTLTEAKGPGLLICSKTSDNPDELEFQTDPDAWIEKNNPNWIIYTPTLENGLDISKWKGCTDVFGLFCGLLGVNSLIQMLRRVRHPLNQISVLCPQRGLNVNSDRRSYYSSQIKLQIEVGINIESALLCPADYQEAIREEVNRKFADPLFAACCDFEAQENLEKSELRAFLVEALRDGGYEVNEPTIGGDESGDHANKKIACKEKEAQEIFDSPDISLEEAQEISRSNKARWPERCQAEKCFLKARLPGIEDAKLWGWEFIDRIRSKDRSLLSQLENSWLFHNPDDAEYLQKSKWESGKFESFLPDHSPQWLKLTALHKLQISQFLNPDPDACWNNESPEIKKLLRDGSRADARKILGEPGKDGIKYLNRLLGLIGRKLVHKQARGEDGKRIHEYRYQPQPTIRLSRKGPIRICSLPEDWPELAELTAARMSQKIEAKKATTKSAETEAAYSLDAVTDASDFININIGSSVTETTPENTTAAGAAGAISQVAIDAENLIARWTGWVHRTGKWCEARVTGWCENGTRYVVEYLRASGDIGEMLVFPEKFFTAEGGA